MNWERDKPYNQCGDLGDDICEYQRRNASRSLLRSILKTTRCSYQIFRHAYEENEPIILHKRVYSHGMNAFVRNQVYLPVGGRRTDEKEKEIKVIECCIFSQGFKQSLCSHWLAIFFNCYYPVVLKAFALSHGFLLSTRKKKVDLINRVSQHDDPIINVN